MEQFKRAQVIMLPTGSNLEFPYIAQNVFNKQLTIVNSTFAINCELQSQHLYIISDDEIKEGDWFINLFNNVIVQAHNWIYVSTCKKIIATTDTSLTIDCIINKNKVYHLPQPSQQFIEKYIEEYNKGNIITDVLVEYMQTKLYIKPQNYQQYISQPKELQFPITTDINNIYNLKVNPKDNTITIKKVKDSWNREDVYKIIRKAITDTNKAGFRNISMDYNKWIEENL